MCLKGDFVLFCIQQKRQVKSLVMKILAKKKESVLILFAMSCCAELFKTKQILLTSIFTFYLKQTFINWPGSLTRHIFYFVKYQIFGIHIEDKSCE